MKTVLVFGTFDVIHPGHIYFLQKAAAEGDRLVAVIARDRFVLKTKKRNPVHGEEERISHIMQSGLVDEAFLSDEVTGTYGVVEKVNPQVVCFGHDQHKLAESFTQWISNNDKKIQIVTIEPYKRDRYSSTLRNKNHY
ncbi:adenylyltransferase/cytidyltransferase family protein [Spirochaeta isovalerica]|uniref:Cytidyltransferase-like protein n=1 Tax=Spirochaeta isovalerica TaxID=150 RepID=A0A841R6K7_9SPIO|nr:adenylyltransferase/cytidyltransferase family protein [Spirochaeta isovalerica]MBB6478629.1 cytidyltransferase-like protein [Spirochaeta isovalerica]